MDNEKTMPVCSCGGFDYVRGLVMICPRCGGGRPSAEEAERQRAERIERPCSSKPGHA